MESPRYLRIALPPFVFYGAVILAETLNGSLLCTIGGWDDSAALIAGIIAASIVPLGFVIGGATTLALKCFAKRGWVGYGRYDNPHRPEDTALLLNDLKVSGTWTSNDHLNAARTFVYEARKEWWLAGYVNRLWDAAMAYSGSVIALLIAAIYACSTNNYKSLVWWAVVVIALAIFIGMCRSAREDMSSAVAFQIKHRNTARTAIQEWKPSETGLHP
jgi:hypothetical protein